MELSARVHEGTPQSYFAASLGASLATRPQASSSIIGLPQASKNSCKLDSERHLAAKAVQAMAQPQPANGSETSIPNTKYVHIYRAPGHTHDNRAPALGSGITMGARVITGVEAGEGLLALWLHASLLSSASWLLS